VLGRGEETQIEPDVTMIATVRTEGEGSQSIAGSVMGTPAYMPPEQAMGQIDMLDERSDVFALGAVLCELLTGKPPYVGEVRDQLLLASQARLDDAHARLDACGADAELVALCKKALAPTRGERPRNAAALAAGIGKHLTGVEERARAAEVASAESKAAAAEQETLERQAQLDSEQAHRARRRVMTLTAAVLLVAIGGGVSYSMLAGARLEREADAVKAVTAEIGKARRLEGSGEWDEAQRAATGAVALAEAGRVDEATAERAAATLRDVNHGAKLAAAEAERVRHNAQFLADLERVREGGTRYSGGPAIDAAYVEAFRTFGIDIDAPARDAIAFLEDRRPDAFRVGIALDYWAILRKHYWSLEGRAWEPLLRIAGAYDPDPLRDRLRQSVVSGEHGPALELIQEAETLVPETAQTLALLLEYREESHLAIDFLHVLVARAPSDFWFRYRLGRALYSSEKHREAAPHLQAAVAIRPRSAGAWNMVGLNLAGLREFDESLRAYEHAMKHIQAKWIILMNIGYVYSRTGRIEEGLQLLRQANEQTHRRQDVASWLAAYLWMSGSYEEALSWFRKSIDLDPKWWNSHMHLGRRLLWLGRFQEALDESKLARSLDPDWVKEFEVAIPQRMLELQPSLHEFLREPSTGKPASLLQDYAMLCFCTGRNADCVRLLREAKSQGTDLPSPHRYFGAQAALRAASDSKPEEAHRHREFALRWLVRELGQDIEEFEGLDAKASNIRGEKLSWCRYRVFDFRRVQGEALRGLPEREREQWEAHWRDVEKLMWRAWRKAHG